MTYIPHDTPQEKSGDNVERRERLRARMVAEEVVRLLVHNGLVGNETLDVAGVASLLGKSRKWVYNHIEDIPHATVGKTYRFRRSDISEFLMR